MDRNFLVPRKGWGIFGSPPARVAWIEILTQHQNRTMPNVATREGGVDRNCERPLRAQTPMVATREGGVDRNRRGYGWQFRRG